MLEYWNSLQPDEKMQFAGLVITGLICLVVLIVGPALIVRRHKQIKEMAPPVYDPPTVAHIGKKVKVLRTASFTLWVGTITINGLDHMFAALWRNGQINIQIVPAEWVRMTQLRLKDYEHARFVIRAWVEERVKKQSLQPPKS
jgi:hypothetical protein